MFLNHGEARSYRTRLCVLDGAAAIAAARRDIEALHPPLADFAAPTGEFPVRRAWTCFVVPAADPDLEPLRRPRHCRVRHAARRRRRSCVSGRGVSLRGDEPPLRPRLAVRPSNSTSAAAGRAGPPQVVRTICARAREFAPRSSAYIRRYPMAWIVLIEDRKIQSSTAIGPQSGTGQARLDRPDLTPS